MKINKKILRIILAIIVIIISLGAIFIGLFYDQNKWQTYINFKYNFTIQYPTKWPIQSTSVNNASQIFSSPDKKIVCRVYGFENSIKNKNGTRQDLNQLIDWLATNLPNDKIIAKNDTTMGGHNAKELLMQKGAEHTQGVYILGKATGRAFICTYADLKSENAFKKDFKNMQASFTLTAPLDPQTNDTNSTK